jgi:hypothetical protein
MKAAAIYILVFLLGGLGGFVLHYSTSGASDRARIAALEDELKARNAKLDKCTDVLLQMKTGQPTQAPQQ